MARVEGCTCLGRGTSGPDVLQVGARPGCSPLTWEAQAFLRGEQGTFFCDLGEGAQTLWVPILPSIEQAGVRCAEAASWASLTGSCVDSARKACEDHRRRKQDEVPEGLKPGTSTPSGKPTWGTSLQETESACGTGVCSPTFTQHRSQQPGCPAAGKWAEKARCTTACHSATKKKEILPFVTTWVDLEGTVPSEITQRSTNTA